MPNNEQLNAMAKMLGYSFNYASLNLDAKHKVMELTIASIQAKALAEINYNYAFACQKRRYG